MKISIVEWPQGLRAGDVVWQLICRQVEQATPFVLVTNEMPFGPWLAADADFDREAAAESVYLHEQGLEALKALGVPLIISSRPVWAGNRLANEAFVLEYGQYRFLHQKHYFPAEDGFQEANWFQTSKPGFAVTELAGVRVGVLLCTEIMFNERARAYGRAGAELIVVPRATGNSPRWITACAMAAVISGCYVASSNRCGALSNGTVFGGGALAYAPDGSLIGATDEANAMLTFDFDRDAVLRQQRAYPCYVSEALQLSE